MTTAELLAKHGIDYVFTKSGKFTTTCPGCAGGYLNVEVKKDGVVWYCPVCCKGSGESFELAAPHSNGKGNSKRKGKLGEPTAIYDYPNERGERLFQVLRFEPKDAPKKFLQRIGPEQKKWSIKGVRRVLYRLPEVVAAVANKRGIVVTEGEKDVETLRKHGFTATTIPMGATSEDKQKKGSGWLPEYSESLRGADVVLCGDNDDQGHEHVRIIARCLAGIAGRVRILDLKLHWPQMDPSDDVTDWFAAGHTKDELEVLLAGAPDNVQPEPSSTREAPVDDDAEIERLAKLKALDYDRARKAAATQFKVRASLLDKLVLAKRVELGLVGKGDDDQGEAVTFEDVAPWPGPVDGAALLNEIAEAIGSHIIMESFERDIAALWIIHTYIVRHFMISPKFWVRSAVRRCGKSTLIDVLAHLVNRPWTTGSITKAALFRVIAKWRPTLLIDEVDTFVGEDEELRGMLNLSHRYDGSVTRTVGDTHEPRKFPVYAAVALSGIGGLAATLADRSLPVTLRRKKRDEKTKPLRIGKTGHLDELRRRIVRWVADHEEAIAERDPEMPSSLLNREADNWTAVLAIADEAAWSQRARQAAEAAHKASAGEEDSVDIVERLLSDCRNILKPRAALIAEYNKTAQGKLAPIEKIGITSVALTDSLTALEDGPWREWGKSNKPITQNALARLLRRPGLNIRPEPEPIRTVVKTKDETAGQTWWMDVRSRGYLLAAFQDAFDRLLPPEHVRESAEKGDCNRDTVTRPINMGTSSDSQPCQDGSFVTVAKSQKPASNGPESHLHGCEGGKTASARTVSPPHSASHAPDATPNPGEPCADGLSPTTRQQLADLARRTFPDPPHAGDEDDIPTFVRERVLASGVDPAFIEGEVGSVLAIIGKCSKCGYYGGNVMAWGSNAAVQLHRKCEDEWIEKRMAEEGIWRA
jgi:Protein of unknown function (DUF3631)